MERLQHYVFLIAFSLVNAHELDAMTQSEWRLLYILRSLPDPVAEQYFVLLHVPLMAVLLHLSFGDDRIVSLRTRALICAFGPIHALLHGSLSDHPQYSFDSPLSLGLIAGYAVAGMAYLLLRALVRERSGNKAARTGVQM